MKRIVRTLALLLAATAAVLLWRALDGREHAGPLQPEAPVSSAAQDDPGIEAEVDGAAEAVDREVVDGDEGEAELRVTHVVSGRVVDERRFPVADATVTVHGADLPLQAPTRSAEDGAFSFDLKLRGGLVVRDADVAARTEGRAAVGDLYLPAAKPDGVREHELDALVLFDARPLTVRVLADGAPVPDARVDAAVGNTRVPADSARTDARGAARFTGLPEGSVHFVARAGPLAGRGTAWIPRDAEATVRLCDVTRAAVLVVDGSTHEPVAGARVRASERYMAPMALRTDPDVLQRSGSERIGTGASRPIEVTTDADGRAVLRELVPGGRYGVEVFADGYRELRRPPIPAPRLDLECDAPPDVLRIELDPIPERSVRWPVIGGEVPPPADGTRFAVRFAPGSVRAVDERPLPEVDARMEGTELAMDRAPADGALLVEAPDGSLARAWIPSDDEIGKEVSFRRPRTIEVILRDARGEPTPNVRVGARNPGNPLLGEPASTDSTGRAVLEGLYGRSTDVLVVRGPTGGRTGTLGTIDLEAGDGRIVATWPRPEPERARVRLRVLLDGIARLPARYRLERGHAAEVVEEFPERGELLVELTCPEDDEPAELSLISVDHGRATAEVPCRPGSTEPFVTVELESLGTLVAHVVPPDEDYVSILPQRRDPETGEWTRPRELFLFRGLHWANGPDGAFVFRGLEAGLYRVTDTRTNRVSDSVELPAGGRRVEVALDLSADAWVEGRVEVPDSRWMSDVRILVGDQRPPSAPMEEWFDPSRWERPKDGRFRVRVPVGEETVVRPWHPWLEPAAVGGVHVARGAQDDVVLRLVEGDGIVLPVDPMPEAEESVRVARYAAGTEPTGAPLAWHRLDVDGDALRGSLPAGTWTLFVDVDRTHAPLVLEDVEIHGVTELPPRTLGRGGSVRVRVLLPSGSDPAEISGHALALDEPIHRRYLSESGTEVVLTGLATGRYRVRMARSGSYADGVERVIESDGVGKVLLELDLR